MKQEVVLESRLAELGEVDLIIVVFVHLGEDLVDLAFFKMQKAAHGLHRGNQLVSVQGSTLVGVGLIENASEFLQVLILHDHVCDVGRHGGLKLIPSRRFFHLLERARLPVKPYLRDKASIMEPLVFKQVRRSRSVLGPLHEAALDEVLCFLAGTTDAIIVDLFIHYSLLNSFHTSLVEELFARENLKRDAANGPYINLLVVAG